MQFEDDDELEMSGKKNDEDFGPRAVFTVSGIPKDKDPVRLMAVVDALSEVAEDSMTGIEIGMVKGLPDQLAADTIDQNEYAQMQEEFVANGIHGPLLINALHASNLVMTGAFMYGDIKTDEDWNAKSEEEKEAIKSHYREKREQQDREIVASLRKNRTEEIREVFDVANKWATEPELNPIERCHGVAQELYKKYGHDAKVEKRPDGTEHVWDLAKEAMPVSAGQAYADHYDEQFKESITAKINRSAKDLFD